ncbi:MAG: class I SAM-dependent methyltransferase [Bacillaceae bacterium]
MITDQIFLAYIQTATQPFSGWDFSFLSKTGRIQEELLPWSYGSIVLPYVQRANAMLDMGTGGGEFLEKLQPYPTTICATEGYEPNVPIAQKRLEPLGVKVVQVEDDNNLPFADDYFDFVMNRHESYSPKEVRRILSDNGVFITQQVGAFDCIEINEHLGAPINEEFASWNLQTAVNELKENHFNVTYSKEASPIQRFYDIGALIYYLKAIPWQVVDFEIDKYLEKLYQIHHLIQTKGYLDVKQQRFIIKAETK